jgi:6-phosphogluconolactonase/glucosamine-6-phosphate isomerase/deaminase
MDDPIEVAPLVDDVRRLPHPRLAGRVIVRPSPDELVDAMTLDLLIHSRACVRAFGDFHLAVSYGPMLDPLLRRLMFDPPLRDFPWIRTHLWAVDDSTSGERRSTALRDFLVGAADIPEHQTHLLEAGDGDAEAQADAYEREIKEHLGWREKGHDRFDLVLLPMDPSGDIAGIPGTTDGEREGALVRVRAGGSRVGVSLGMVNAARFVCVVAMGGECARAVAGLSGGGARGSAGLVRPLAGEQGWYLDAAACRGEP